MSKQELSPLLISCEKIGENEYNGIPDLMDLLAAGGYPGVEYCLVPPQFLGEHERAGWWQVPGMKSLTLHGSKGSADGVLLMGEGEPIVGTFPTNGRRHYYARTELLVTLGYLDAPTRADVDKLRQATEANKAAAVGAARHAVDNAHTSPLPSAVPGAR